MLEANLYPNNSFLTLTYSDDHLPMIRNPKTSGPNSIYLASLDPKHLQNWLKRFREAISPSKIRFYAVGEYGDETNRPHYHVALFNYPACAFGRTRNHRENCCPSCDLVRRTWSVDGQPIGNILLGTLTNDSASYVAGYVTKKLTSRDDPRLNGRHPEFSRMSRRPGIGYDFMHEVASTVLQHDLSVDEDVPTTLRHGSRTLPLGRYLTRRLRKLTGRDEKAPQTKLDAIAEELRPLREIAFDNSRSFKQEVVKDGDQKVLNAETKAKIFGHKRKTL